MTQWERGGPSPEPGNAADLPPAGSTAAAVVEAEETVFSLIAARARSHSTAHLALTAVIGVLDAAAIAWAHPSFWPVAMLFAAAGAYGAWGLIDRAVAHRAAKGPSDAASTMGLRVLRESVALLGLVAVVAAVAGIFGASLGTWIS